MVYATFAPRHCHIKQDRACGGKEMKTPTWSVEEASHQLPQPAPTSIWFDLSHPPPQASSRVIPTGSQMLCCLAAPGFLQRKGQTTRFPWENMLPSAIRTKPRLPVSSTLISLNKTQAFLPRGVSKGQEKEKSKRASCIGLKTLPSREPRLWVSSRK